MNNLIAGAAFRALVSVGGAYLSAKGIASVAEVSQFTDQAVSILSGIASLTAAGYGVYTRFTAKQVAMTNSLPKVVSPAVAKK